MVDQARLAQGLAPLSWLVEAPALLAGEPKAGVIIQPRRVSRETVRPCCSASTSAAGVGPKSA